MRIKAYGNGSLNVFLPFGTRQQRAYKTFPCMVPSLATREPRSTATCLDRDLILKDEPTEFGSQGYNRCMQDRVGMCEQRRVGSPIRQLAASQRLERDNEEREMDHSKQRSPWMEFYRILLPTHRTGWVRLLQFWSTTYGSRLRFDP